MIVSLSHHEWWLELRRKKVPTLTHYLIAISQSRQPHKPTLVPPSLGAHDTNQFAKLSFSCSRSVVAFKMSICVMNRIENIVDIINKFSISNLFAIPFSAPFR